MKRRGKIHAGIVEGHARGDVGLIKGHARGDVKFVTGMEGARVRMWVPVPTAIIRGPDGREIVLANPRDLLTLGKAVKPHAHTLGSILLLTAVSSRRKGGEPIVSFDLLNIVAWLLLALPRSRRGRPRAASTDEAIELSIQRSLREATRQIAKRTGEDPENIRSRVLGVKRRARKGGNKFK